MLEHYRPELQDAWLEILSAIPETCRPRRFSQLLPSLAGSAPGGPPGERLAEGVVGAVDAAGWYARRAKEIEARSGLVDYALEMLELAHARLRSDEAAAAAQHEALGELMADLRHLYMLVYECGLQDLTLEAWQGMSMMQRLQCFTRESSRDAFAGCIRHVAGPYLASLPPPQAERLLHDFLADLASSRLDWCAEVFKGSTIEEPLYTFATSQSLSPAAGREWKRQVPAVYAEWSAPPPDNVQGQIDDAVLLVEFARDVSVGEQVRVSGGEVREVCVYTCECPLSSW